MKRTELRRKTPLTSKQPLQNRSPLQRRTELRPARSGGFGGLGSRPEPQRRSALPAASKKRQRQNREYSKLRDVFLAAHPRCEFPGGCCQPATEVQHRRGRRGDRLNDTAWWAASCHDHNAWAEDHTGEALACGWLVRIEGAA